MISVAMFTYSTRPRGSVVHAAALSEALRELGCEVTLHTLSKEGEGFYRELSCELELWRAAPAPDDPDALIAQRIQEVASHVRRMSRTYDIYHAQDCLTASGLLQSGSLRGRTQLSRSPLARSLLARTVHHVEL
ncbi:MAG TPA: glycosyltransferase, partial [Polyangiaceae bacterium]|nr:glycosyltransferase [Polyangiaceae bacterium]